MVSHLDIAHFILGSIVRKGDTVIDATCGNGNDAALLADLALSHQGGELHCFDIQSDAIEATRKRLQNHPYNQQINFHLASHTKLPACSPSAIVYNLGYLPGGNKAITTVLNSTFESLDMALSILKPGGALLVTFYPGHPEGAKELSYGQTWLALVGAKKFKIFVYNQRTAPSAPQLFVIKKPFQKYTNENI